MQSLIVVVTLFASSSPSNQSFAAKPVPNVVDGSSGEFRAGAAFNRHGDNVVCKVAWSGAPVYNARGGYVKGAVVLEVRTGKSEKWIVADHSDIAFTRLRSGFHECRLAIPIQAIEWRIAVRMVALEPAGRTPPVEVTSPSFAVK